MGHYIVCVKRLVVRGLFNFSYCDHVTVLNLRTYDNTVAKFKSVVRVTNKLICNAKNIQLVSNLLIHIQDHEVV